MALAAPSQQATRHARRIYVGGLPPTASEQNVAVFFSNALAAVGGTTAGPGESDVLDLRTQSVGARACCRSCGREEAVRTSMEMHPFAITYGSPVRLRQDGLELVWPFPHTGIDPCLCLPRL